MGIANQTPQDVASDYATTRFIIEQILNGVATAALVRIQDCTNAGGVEPVGMVTVQLLVDMVTQEGDTVPHGQLFRVPYVRWQGGVNAVILDPEAGDLGVCVFASRDISAVKGDPEAARTRAPTAGAPPGSRRVYSLSDAIYIGGLLNKVPEQFVQFSADGIMLKSPTKVTIEAPQIDLKGPITQTGGDVTMAAGLAVSGTMTGQGTNLHTHKHGGVTVGGGQTGVPV